MDESISNFDITASTVKIHNADSNSDQSSDNFEELVDSDEVIQTETNQQDKMVQMPFEHEEADFDNNLPDTVSLLRDPKNGAKIYLIGTAHFSKHSQDEVVKVMQIVKPHVVMLELCDSRTALLTLDEETMLEESKKLNFENIMNLIKRNGIYCGLTYILILNLNKHITKEIGMPPGGEFRVAYQEAMKLPNCAVILGDRPIKITLLRALSKLSWFQTIKLAFNLIFSKETINKEDVENCKKRDMLEQLLAEMADEYPALGEVFVNERDIFLTHSLQQAASSNHLVSRAAMPGLSENLRVVGVVGIGHVIGMTKLWNHNQAQYVPEVMIVPPPTMTSRILKFTIKWSFYAFAGYLVFKYVPVPKTVRRSAQLGLQTIFQGSQSSLLYIKNHCYNYIHS